MIGLTIRHIRRHWRLYTAVLLCLTLASALLASLAIYASAIAAQELAQTLNEARPAERSLLITGTPFTFRDELYEDIQSRLGKVLRERVVMRHITVPADPQPGLEEPGSKQIVDHLDVYSFDKLPENVRVVEGKLPAQVNLGLTVGYWPPPMDAVIGLTAAEQSGYGIGDRLTASGMYHRLDIVGIVEPLAPDADLWGEDLTAFSIVTETEGLDTDTIALPLLIAPTSMQTYLAKPVFPHEIAWRITLNHHLLRPDKTDEFNSSLVNFQTQSATAGARISTSLIQILTDYQERLSHVSLVHTLLMAQTLIFVVFALTTFTPFVLDHSRAEFATLSAQGASAWQTIQAYVLANLSLALLAASILGPGLALAVTVVWAKYTTGASPLWVPGEAWLLSGGAAGLGWLALALPAYLAARRNTLGEHQERAHPPHKSLVHRFYLDLFLLAFGLLLYWQLNQAGSFLTQRLGSGQLNDPVLLIGPLLLLVGLALFLMRLLPFPLQLAARIVQRLRGLVLPLGMLHLARDPLQPSRLVLLVGLTAGIVLFTYTFGASIALALADISMQWQALQSDMLMIGVGSSLDLNALLLVLFSATVFFLALILASRGRERELAILSAQGLTVRQWLTLLITEGITVLCLGLVVGAIVGLGLSTILLPYLFQALSQALTLVLAGSPGGLALERSVVNWAAVARLYLLLIAVYGGVLALVWLALRHALKRPALWMEDE